MADGSITFDTSIDNKKLEEDLASLKGKIEKAEEALDKKRSESSGLTEELDKARETANQTVDAIRKLREEKDAIDSAINGTAYVSPSQYESMQDRLPKITEELDRQEATLDQQRQTIDRINGRQAVCGDQLVQMSQDLEQMKAEAGDLGARIQQAGEAVQGSSDGYARMGEAIQEASGKMDKFIARVKRLASRVFVFSVITAALRLLRTWLKNIVATDSEAAAAMSQLRGALLTLAQPLAEVIIPLFTTLVRILTSVISVIAQIVAMLTGKSISSMKSNAKALNAQAGAIDNVGSAAKEASKYLAGFDELNVMDSSDTGDGGSGGGSAAPDFDFDATKSTEELQNILGLIELIAGGLLAWKLGNGVFDTLQKAVGFFLLIDGVIHGIQTYIDAWENGVDFENLSELIGRIAEAVVGLWIALGPTAAAIGLITGGVALLVLGIKDAMEVGFNAENLMTTITGMLLGGLGIAILTGSWIPLLIAAITGLLLVIVNFFGDSEELLSGLKEMLSGFKDFFSGIFSGDIAKSIQGIGKIFSGLRTVVGSIVDAMENMFNSFLDWLDKKTGGKLHGIIETVKALVGNAFQYVREILTAFLNVFQSIFTGLTKFLSGVFTGNWTKAWEGIKDIFKGIVNGIADLFGATVNAIIRGLNWLIGKMNQISFTAPSWVPGIGGKTIGINIPTIAEWQVPHLAQGAVLPPNQPFLAMVGDQKHGTNVEAPLETIQEAVALVMDDVIASNLAGHEAVVGVLREILQAILGIEIGDDIIGRAVERYNRKRAVMRGV